MNNSVSSNHIGREEQLYWVLAAGTTSLPPGAATCTQRTRSLKDIQRIQRTD
jgi:hypothetical protein